MAMTAIQAEPARPHAPRADRSLVLLAWNVVALYAADLPTREIDLSDTEVEILVAQGIHALGGPTVAAEHGQALARYQHALQMGLLTEAEHDFLLRLKWPSRERLQQAYGYALGGP